MGHMIFSTHQMILHQMKSFKDFIYYCRPDSQRLILHSAKRTNCWWYNSKGILWPNDNKFDYSVQENSWKWFAHMRTADGTCGAAILSNQWAVTG